MIKAVRRTTRTDCGHGCVIRRAGEGRASAPIRALVAVFVAFACAISVSSYASAEESGGGGGGHSFEGPNVGIIFYGPTPALDSNANQVTEVGVTAYNEFDAAAYVLGYSYGEVRSWSADIRAKLSNRETGGRFWQFAKTFTHANNIDGIQWFTANILYGTDLCWRSLYSDDLYRDALVDCQKVINGEDIGGGGSGDVAAEFTFNGANNYRAQVNWSQSFIDNINARSWDFTLSTAAVDAIRSHVGDYPYVYARGVPTLNSTDIKVNKVAIIMTSQPLVPNVQSYTVELTTTDCWYWETTNKNYVHGSTTSLNFQTLSHATSSKSFGDSCLWCIGISDIAGGGGDPVVPPTQWPDEPSAPSPPELPEPGTNPTVTPTPWAPVISPTFDFDLNITTEPTSNDLIDWVKKIYYELRSFHTDAQDWFEEVGKGIDGVVKAVDDAQKQIYSELQTIDDTLRDEGHKIRDYMYQMFHWLKDQLNFQNDAFNDSNIVYWLKRIWSKLGNGDINVRPTDPTTDPTGVWDWLIKLIQNFLIGLASSANDLISEMADLVSQVMHQFPFSIPWDIAAFLAAFAAAPITPDVDVTIPAIEGWWGETVISIDLSPYDTAAAAVRAMEKILFAAFLAWKSKDLLEFMDVTKWFNG